jgi:hypothetical protein
MAARLQMEKERQEGWRKHERTVKIHVSSFNACTPTYSANVLRFGAFLTACSRRCSAPVATCARSVPVPWRTTLSTGQGAPGSVLRLVPACWWCAPRRSHAESRFAPANKDCECGVLETPPSLNKRASYVTGTHQTCDSKARVEINKGQ